MNRRLKSAAGEGRQEVAEPQAEERRRFRSCGQAHEQAEERRCVWQGVRGIGIVGLVVLVGVPGAFPGSASDDGDGDDDDGYDDDDDDCVE